MKRALVLLVTAAVATAPLSAQAAKPKPTKRVVTFTYQGFVGTTTPAVSGTLNEPACGATGACYELQTLKHEKQVAFSTGGPAVQVYLDGDYEGTVQTYCGSGVVPVSKGSLVSFRMAVDPTCSSAPVPTQGTVTLTITGKK